MTTNSKNTIDTKSGEAKTAILLCTHNSAKFLREQLDSFYKQTYKDWELWVSDDGSQDDTLNIVQSYSDRGKRIVILSGPNRGATVNFLSLLRNPAVTAEYCAWSDADDIWLPDKLERAVRHLDRAGTEQAALYCGRTQVVDENNQEMHLSPLFSRPPCFKNALCQNVGGGNTMVFNRRAKEIVSEGDFPNILFHDWWAYILVSGCGGSVYYDPEPCLRYRQHGDNLVGGNMGLVARYRRCRRLFLGEMSEWNKSNVAALDSLRNCLTIESRDSLDFFKRSMNAGHFWERLSCFKRSGVFRQKRMDNIALWLASAIGAFP